MMVQVLLLLLALAAAYAGMGAIALANPAYWGAAVHLPSPTQSTRRNQRRLGSVLLVLAIASAIARDGWSFGLILALLVMAVAAALIIATLTRAPRTLRFLVLPGHRQVEPGSD